MLRNNIVAGVFFIIAGIILFFWTLKVLSFGSIWPIILLLIGLYLLYRVLFIQNTNVYIVPAVFLLIISAFFVFLQISQLNPHFIKIWPIFCTAGGLSLLCYYFFDNQNKKLSILIPSIVLIVFSIVFFLFSLKIITISFVQALKMYWPIFIIFVGITLIITQYRSKNRK